MGIIKISTMNESKQVTYNLLGYSFQPIEIEQVTILEINSSVDSIKYRIWADENARDIDKINSFISSQFENALLNNKIVHLIEEPTRNYIYFNTDDESRKMFSGRRL